METKNHSPLEPLPLDEVEAQSVEEALKLPVVQRSLVPAYDWTYNAYVVGKTHNNVQVEADVHFGGPGIVCGRELLSLLTILQERLIKLFSGSVHLVPEMVCSIYRARGSGGFHIGWINNLYLGAYPPPKLLNVAAFYVCEAVEIFAHLGDRNWDSDWSHGEALSRLLGNAYVPNQLHGLQTVPTWLNTPGRPDWVSRSAPSETETVPVGCAVAFIHYLHEILGHPLSAIVDTPGNTLELKYEHLTGKRGGYAAMMEVLNKKFPPGKPVPDVLELDSPFMHSV